MTEQSQKQTLLEAKQREWLESLFTGVCPTCKRSEVGRTSCSSAWHGSKHLAQAVERRTAERCAEIALTWIGPEQIADAIRKKFGLESTNVK